LVLFLALPSTLSSLTLSASNFISLHPGLINELAGHTLVHNLYSHMHSSKKSGLSRRARRKNANIRRRWFVDNIILHHKRLHDKNRELAVNKARDLAIARRDAAKKRQELSLQRAKEPQLDQERRWRDMARTKGRASTIRERIDSRRLRALSRWSSVAEENSAAEN
jgi:hypothetical protein